MSSSSPAPELTVAVCTWNPEPRVRETLASLRCQTLSAAAYEVIVVDNASADAAAATLRELCAEFGFRYLREDRAGLSHARNRAVVAAAGRCIHFIDDDAVAPAHLLETLLGLFDDESVAVAGGPAHGLWDVTPPRWLGSRYWRLLSLLSHGGEPRALAYPEILLGCNVAFRRAAVDDESPFRVELGRTGEGLLGNEERDLQRRLMQRGARVLYDPRAYVFHRVTTRRMTREHLSARLAGGATSGFVMENRRPRALALLVRFLYRLLRNVAVALRVAGETFVTECAFEWAALRGGLAARRLPPTDTDAR